MQHCARVIIDNRAKESSTIIGHPSVTNRREQRKQRKELHLSGLQE